MTLEILSRYNYKADKYVQMSDTKDWVQVAKLHSSDGGYDWADFNAFYSPSARRYFWSGDSGCSCNSWGDNLSGASDFENGDKDALLRAWKSFAKKHTYTVSASHRQSGADTIRNFEEPK